MNQSPDVLPSQTALLLRVKEAFYRYWIIVLIGVIALLIQLLASANNLPVFRESAQPISEVARDITITAFLAIFIGYIIEAAHLATVRASIEKHVDEYLTPLSDLVESLKSTSTRTIRDRIRSTFGSKMPDELFDAVESQVLMAKFARKDFRATWTFEFDPNDAAVVFATIDTSYRLENITATDQPWTPMVWIDESAGDNPFRTLHIDGKEQNISKSNLSVGSGRKKYTLNPITVGSKGIEVKSLYRFRRKAADLDTWTTVLPAYSMYLRVNIPSDCVRPARVVARPIGPDDLTEGPHNKDQETTFYEYELGGVNTNINDGLERKHVVLPHQGFYFDWDFRKQLSIDQPPVKPDP